MVINGLEGVSQDLYYPHRPHLTINRPRFGYTVAGCGKRILVISSWDLLLINWWADEKDKKFRASHPFN